MRRAAVSIPSNIAEGQSRNTTKEFIRFLSMAKGSNAELRTQLLICVRVAFFSPSDIQEAMSLSDEVGKMGACSLNAVT
jgi:four helix bundle protein